MEFSASKFLRGAALVLALASIAGCNQQKNAQEKFGRPRLRMACATELQKYCADEPRKRRCLRENMDKLGDSCKAALAQLRGHRQGGARNRDND